MTQTFDAIIIGTGQAGPFLASRLTAAGMTVAIVERKLFGGTCVNTGCTPTKAMVASAYAAHLARRAGEYGVRIGGDVVVDLPAVQARKSAIAAKSRSGLESWLGGMSRCTIFRGHACLEGPNEVSIESGAADAGAAGGGHASADRRDGSAGDRAARDAGPGTLRLSASRIFINVGGRARVPQMPGIGDVRYLTNSSIMDLDELPRHLVIVGGSYIGLELGQMFRRFGSEVTIIEQGDRLIRREDPDVSDAIATIFEGEGIALRLNAACIGFRPHGDGAIARVECSQGEPEVRGSHVLLAVGRRPNTDDLGLERAGVETDEHGFITVDDQLRTNVPGIWAVGDCNGKGAFTHTTWNDAEIVAANLLDNDPRRVSDRIVTYGLFIDPPLGRAGMTETEVRTSGRRALMGTRPMTKVNRALEKGEPHGFMKVLVDAETKQFLGASILGTGGDEVIHAVLDLMYAKAPYTVMQRAVHVHPTVTELLPTLLGDLKPLKPLDPAPDAGPRSSHDGPDAGRDLGRDPGPDAGRGGPTS